MTKFPVKELARRAHSQDKLTRVLDLFSKELVNQKAQLNVIHEQLIETQNAVERINDLQALEAARGDVKSIEQALVLALEHVNIVMAGLAEFENLMKEQPRKLPGQLSDEAIDYLRKIIAVVSQIPEDVAQMRNVINQIRNIIEKKRKMIA